MRRGSARSLPIAALGAIGVSAAIAAACVSIPDLVAGGDAGRGDATLAPDAGDASGEPAGPPDAANADGDASDGGGTLDAGDAGLACPGTYPQAVESLPDLVGYWRLGDTGSVAKDETAKHPGTYTSAVRLGQPSLLVGDPDPAAAFDGDAGTYVAIPQAADLDVQTFTLGAIIKPSAIVAADQGQQILAKTGQWWLQLMPPANGGSTPQIETGFIDPASADDYGRGSSAALAVGQTAHVVGTYDGRSIVVYVDGVFKDAQAYDAGVVKAGTQLFIGSWDGATHVQSGVIDEVFVTASAISAEQVAALYLAAQGCAHDAGP